MTNEVAIKAIQDFIGWFREDSLIRKALDMAIKALSQEPCEDAVSREDAIKALQKVACYSAAIRARMIGAIEDLPSVTQKPLECDDAVSRILQRMWNCRGKHTTSIDKVAMEQIIRDELSVTQKSGKWIGIDEKPHEDYECSCCGYVVSTFTANIEPHTEYKYCPNCGAKMGSEDKE